MSAATVVSAPGKVLLAGGYLVLDPAHSGVVVSTSSRFYTLVHPISHAPTSSLDAPVQIRVRSPQFLDATWLYSVDFDGPAAVRVEQLADNASTKNKFVHLALHRTLTLAAELKSVGTLQNTLSHGLDITIVGDNDFYSQRAQLAAHNLPPTLDSLEKLPPFSKTGVRLPDVHKTGLGSSAALITSLVSALLLHLGVVPADAFAATAERGSGATEGASAGRNLAHNLAQYVHCLAQGKVGSGFDVSAAVFGSQLYTRFDPAVIAPLMADAVPSTPLHPVLSPANRAWTYRAAPFRLPPQTRLMLADVDAGSDTPSLVGRVLKWRKENRDAAAALWGALDALNARLGKTLAGLAHTEARNPTAYRKAVKYISTIQSVQWLANPNITDNQSVVDFKKVIEEFVEAHQISEDIRAKMREMGTLADVPIEPPEQTALLDACVGVAGVVGGGVPGAGGYDAVWLLVCDPPNCAREELPAARVERVWSTYSALDVSPLLAAESAAGGVRVEALGDVRGLAEVVREHEQR